MIRKTLLLFALTALLPFPSIAARVGAPAPAFKATDIQGQTQDLAAYHGKFVVLEWTNSGCPFTRKHYESGNMQALQKQWTSKGVVWLSVLSSAPGQEGYKSAAEESRYLAGEHAAPSAVILDPTGTLGREYEARTTPHMFVIDPSGKLIYDGAIDDHPTTDPGDIQSSKNYVSEALTEALAGRPVSTSHTRPYGCSIKYAN